MVNPPMAFPANTFAGFRRIVPSATAHASAVLVVNVERPIGQDVSRQTCDFSALVTESVLRFVQATAELRVVLPRPLCPSGLVDHDHTDFPPFLISPEAIHNATRISPSEIPGSVPRQISNSSSTRSL